MRRTVSWSDNIVIYGLENSVKNINITYIVDVQEFLNKIGGELCDRFLKVDYIDLTNLINSHLVLRTNQVRTRTS